MFESKYSNFLTVLLVIIIIAVIGLLGFLGYNLYEKYFIKKDGAEFVDAFATTEDENTTEGNNSVSGEETNTTEVANPLDEITDTPTAISGKNKKTYKGFNVVGTIEIPKTNLKYPILEEVTKQTIETAVAMLYGPGPNEVGNTVIIGHNYRNGLFFSNNKKLSVGDKVYITDLTGNKLAYTIYDKFETSDTDTDFITRDTKGLREISLSTCTDDSSARLILLAKSES